MIGNREYFSPLDENDMQVNIELRDNGKYATKGAGIVSVERESGDTLHLKDVLYVPGLRQNLVSVATLEDKGNDIIFSRDKVHLQHLASRCKNQIRCTSNT